MSLVYYLHRQKQLVKFNHGVRTEFQQWFYSQHHNDATFFELHKCYALHHFLQVVALRVAKDTSRAKIK